MESGESRVLQEQKGVCGVRGVKGTKGAERSKWSQGEERVIRNKEGERSNDNIRDILRGHEGQLARWPCLTLLLVIRRAEVPVPKGGQAVARGGAS